MLKSYPCFLYIKWKRAKNVDKGGFAVIIESNKGGNMDKKIVFFDIDGTLLDEKTGLVPKSCVEAIHKAQENGHIVVVNSGRPSSTINPQVAAIGFDGYICGCGTYIEYKGETIFHTTLEEEVRREIVEKIFECNMQTAVEGTKGSFYSDNGTHPLYIELYEANRELGFPIEFYDLDNIPEFDKMAAFYDADGDDKTFREFMKGKFEIIERDKGFIELVPLGYSKATGIQFLIDYLGMNLEQCISIGDSPNDLPMLDYTKESVAMGNSNPILFKKVTYITTDVDKDGIANALKHFGLV